MDNRKMKFILIGASTVGKTALLLRIADGKFHPDTITTIGIEFKKRTEQIQGNEWLIQLWDTTGQERFKKVVSQFFRGIHGAIIVFDLSNRKSLDAITYWVSELKNFVPQSTPKILFGNKSDLVDGELAPDFRQQINKIVKDMNLIYLEGSAKTGENVQQVYYRMVQEGYKLMPPSSSPSPPKPLSKPETVEKPVQLTRNSVSMMDNKKKGGGCC